MKLQDADEFYHKTSIDLSDVPELPRRRDSLTDQLRDLIVVADHLGMEEAVGFLNEVAS